MNTILIGRRLAAIACLSAMPMHAQEESSVDIATSDDDKASKAPPLVEVARGPKHGDAEKINMAKKEARRIYEILMKDEMPELKVAAEGTTHHVNGLELASRDDNGRSVVFRYDLDGRLVRVYIGVDHADADFPAREEAKLNPSETFEKVFGHPPTGKVTERHSKSASGEANGGEVRWITNWPEELEYESGHPTSSLGWHESNGEVIIWDLTRGAKAKLTEQLAGSLKQKPVKITEKQAFDAALESVKSLGFKINSGKVSGPKLCYYNLADAPMDKKRWRHKNRPDVDGASGLVGMLVRFGIPGSFSTVSVLVDHQTGEVLYVASSQ